LDVEASHREADDGGDAVRWFVWQQRYISPAFPIPSQKWCKNFPDDAPVAK
jgi:hypothetical protein